MHGVTRIERAAALLHACRLVNWVPLTSDG
jgi:hypothetical protein